MKTSTKLFAIVAIATATFTFTKTNAQSTMNNMSGGYEMAWRLGFGINGGVFENNSAMDYGYGADVRLQYDVAKALSLTATAGYTRLVPANELLEDIDFIPVKGGVKIFPIQRMYLAGEAGAGFGLKDTEKTNFIYSAGLGYAFMNGIDIGARYEGYVNDVSSTTYFKKTGMYTLRIAYGFKL